MVAGSIEVYFSPKGGIQDRLISLINSSQKSIELAAYAFTNQKISDALLAAIKRGINVNIVFDKSQTKGPQAMIHDSLEKGGASIRLISPPGGIMHDKFLIVDDTTVEWGSYNYTVHAENLNFENATIISDNLLAKKFISDFQTIFSQATLEAKGVRRLMQRFLRRMILPLKHRE